MRLVVFVFRKQFLDQALEVGFPGKVCPAGHFGRPIYVKMSQIGIASLARTAFDRVYTRPTRMKSPQNLSVEGGVNPVDRTVKRPNVKNKHVPFII